ncbi:class I SAM-dependent DNA methyltransferase [Salinibacterium sp. SWN1162]|uniref:HsdM family class I SAM-dependent methyltransferase n=1 Tax=Salinibacterium sp. SWN1162 TaxID=2792053 RepID=UPI0018CEE19C|nr:N-6 DNA methylase [Salinibacterium sp. SWN1162]MBH0009031.1 N-6 DNA methylase [Salinibacterium sp. SWN1162]
MSNETLTEDLTRSLLVDLGYFPEDSSIVVERQQSKVAAIKRLLKAASKTGGPGAGYPDFIITSPANPDLVIAIECKASRLKHESADRDRIADFAVDGVLHYASFLSLEYNVVAIAISGETPAEFRISTFVRVKGSKEPSELRSPRGVELDHLTPFEDYVRAAEYSPEVEKLREAELMAFSRELHDFMYQYAELTEEQKPLLVSGTLLALQDKAFGNSFGDFSPNQLRRRWAEVIKEQIEEAEIPFAKKQDMIQPFSGVATAPALAESTPAFPKGVLHELVRRVKEKVWPFITTYSAFDVVGRFYGEFLKYTGGDKKALGIVLTPRHITELFALLANVGPNDKVVDPCAGTAGFLVAAMDRELRAASTEAERARIKQNNLIGVENQPHMYALAASNMILRGDGKANLYQGSCFTPAIVADIQARNPDVGMINPPYAKKDSDLHELVFVDNMLSMLKPGGMGLAIVPMSCATSPSKHKEALLKKHTLEAVMSMPIELFYPVGVVTCIMVFSAKKPHAESDKKTWFGYWREDGFEKTKTLGRVDLHGRWASIRDEWVDSFRNRTVLAGRSIMAKVTAADEWVAEAYMETDYSNLTQSNFEQVVRDYALFRLTQSPENNAENNT